MSGRWSSLCADTELYDQEYFMRICIFFSNKKLGKQGKPSALILCDSIVLILFRLI